MAWYKDKPDDFYELASSVSDLNESLYKDYICLWWAGKSGGRDYDRGTSGVPVLVDGDIVTLAVNEDYPRLETLRNIPNPGQYHKSTFEIRRYPARYASSADKLAFWAKQFHGSKIRSERYHKTSKGKLYQIQIDTEEFGDYCCRVTFEVYDENKRREFILDETNEDVREGIEFYRRCKNRILEAYPECPLFNRPMGLLPRGWKIVER